MERPSYNLKFYFAHHDLPALATSIKAEGTAQHSLQASIVCILMTTLTWFCFKSGEATLTAAVRTPLSMLTVVLQKVRGMAYTWDFYSAPNGSPSIAVVPQAPNPHYYA